MELIGELFGIDSTVGIWRCFNKHWTDLFPNLSSRSQFAKQCQNLWVVKQKILENLNSSGYLFHIIDGFPIAVCHNKRIIHCKQFKGEAARGYCASKEQYYYGFKGHLVVNQDGEIVNFDVTLTNIDEREIPIELLEGKTGLALGDKGYLGAETAEQCINYWIAIEKPVRKNMRDKLPKKIRNF
ncbi:Transposase DDE domain-containing protein [Thorsellia anophelis DSM 18579]|uniref:Transposase DDE domain-containing protein n=1 Tax=Thorsellia anophelis DSM 18579 TaxID=1123402 RepID=A0A1I0BMI1_9GAMM|nr:Transposase DDE domain-containing protein [Thorsellia anophelis DSM 18579]